MPYNFIPPALSLVLTVIFLFTSDSRPLVKLVVAAVYLGGLYLQFASPYRLVGLIVQIILAIGLLRWMKVA